MKQIYKYLIITGIILLFLGFIFWMGWKAYPHYHKCPTITSEITYIHDTVHHYIIGSFPYYVQGNDIIIHDTIPRVVDTLAILQDYYNKHVYNRKWENDTLLVNLEDTISRNKPIGNIFKYQIKTPFTIIENKIDNSILYNKYLTVGIGIPIKDLKYIDINLNYNWKKGYVGAFYNPELKSFGIRGGITLIKLK
jgi:hypothetical protein